MTRGCKRKRWRVVCEPEYDWRLMDTHAHVAYQQFAGPNQLRHVYLFKTCEDAVAMHNMRIAMGAHSDLEYRHAEWGWIWRHGTRVSTIDVIEERLEDALKP